MTELVKFLFHDTNVPVTLINESRFLQLILEENERIYSTLFYNMNVPNKFETVLFFHGLAVFHARIKKKAMIETQGYRASPLTRFCTENNVHAFQLLFSKYVFEEDSELMMP